MSYKHRVHRKDKSGSSWKSNACCFADTVTFLSPHVQVAWWALINVSLFACLCKRCERNGLGSDSLYKENSPSGSSMCLFMLVICGNQWCAIPAKVDSDSFPIPGHWTLLARIPTWIGIHFCRNCASLVYMGNLVIQVIQPLSEDLVYFLNSYKLVN